MRLVNINICLQCSCGRWLCLNYPQHNTTQEYNSNKLSFIPSLYWSQHNKPTKNRASVEEQISIWQMKSPYPLWTKIKRFFFSFLLCFLGMQIVMPTLAHVASHSALSSLTHTSVFDNCACNLFGFFSVLSYSLPLFLFQILFGCQENWWENRIVFLFNCAEKGRN